jgi:hypothetical protein
MSDRIQEMFSGGHVITEFVGDYPDVPLKPGLDLAELTENDDEPFFLTLELSRKGGTSRNGLLHDEQLGAAIVEHVNTGAITGIMGHIPPSERGTSYPTPDIYWVGAIQKDGKVWGKGYIPPSCPKVREHFRMLKRTKGRGATSIYGGGVREYVDKARGVWRMKEVDLEQIDLAPITRASLQPESDFVITAEMADDASQNPTGQNAVEPVVETEIESDKEPTMDRLEIIAELTAADVALLPEAVREAIVTEYAAQNAQVQRVAELEQELTDGRTRIEELTSERDTLTEQISEYRGLAFQGTVAAKVAELFDWDVTGDDAKAKVNALRKNMQRTILAEMGDDTSAEKLDEVVAELWETEFKPLAETMRDALAGPPAIVGGNTPETDVRARLLEYYSDPANAEAAASRLGLNG